MNMCDIYVLYERFAHIQVNTHMYEDLLIGRALKGVLMCTLQLDRCFHMLCTCERVYHMI